MKQLVLFIFLFFLAACGGSAELRFINVHELPFETSVAGNINQSQLYGFTASPYYKVDSGTQMVTFHSDRLEQNFSAGKRYSVFRQYRNGEFEIFAIEDAPKSTGIGELSIYNLNKEQSVTLIDGAQKLVVAPRSAVTVERHIDRQKVKDGTTEINLSDMVTSQPIVTISAGKAVAITMPK